MKHSFDTDLAAKFGIEAAILFYNLEFWIAKNKANSKHFYEGRHWTYNSVTAWQELFPYMSKDVIRKRLDLLVDSGLLIKGFWSKDKRDRTSWYSINYGHIHLATDTNPIDQETKSSYITDNKHTDTLSSNDDSPQKPVLVNINSLPLNLSPSNELPNKDGGAKNKLYADCVNFWLKEFHSGWAFTAIHGKSIKSLIKKIHAFCLHSNLTGSDAQVLNSFKKMCLSLPEWFRDKDLPVLDSKFNEIITQIKNEGQQKTFHSKNSADRFSDFAGR
jgi:hypothetical protein